MAAVSTGTPISIKEARIIQKYHFFYRKLTTLIIHYSNHAAKQARSSHDHTTNLPTLTKNPLELTLQVFPVVLALAYLFHQLLLRTFLFILHQARVHQHMQCHFPGFHMKLATRNLFNLFILHFLPDNLKTSLRT